MSEQDRKDMRLLDEIAERAGGYVSYFPNVRQHVDLRGIISYCDEKGIEPIDMTLREYNRFVICESV